MFRKKRQAPLYRPPAPGFWKVYLEPIHIEYVSVMNDERFPMEVLFILDRPGGGGGRALRLAHPGRHAPF